MVFTEVHGLVVIPYSVSTGDFMNLWPINSDPWSCSEGDATVLFYILLLSLHLLFWGVSRFPGFLSDPWFLRQNPFFLRQYPVLPRCIRAVQCVVCSGGGRGVPVWLGGVHRLVHGFTWACSLTCQPNLRLHIPSRTPLPQGTGQPSSADHPRVGPCNGDCDASVYSPPYLRKGLWSVICHDFQLRDHN